MTKKQLFLTPHSKSEITPEFLPFRAPNFRGDFDPTCRSLRKSLQEARWRAAPADEQSPQTISASCTSGRETGRSVEILNDCRLDLEFEPSTSNSGSSTR
jgi:hypothetical protein